MPDIVDKATRSRMMSGIKGKNTRPELTIRRALHAKGLRYRLHDKALPGKPDLVFPKYHAVVFVHGCFWHGHTCHLFKWPSSRTEFWKQKIMSNQENDKRRLTELAQRNWRVLEVWECSIKGRTQLPLDHIAEKIREWLLSDQMHAEISGE